MIYKLKTIGLGLFMILALSGCERYDGWVRYPCQEFENWDTPECQKPQCEVSGICTDDLLGTNQEER